MEPVLSDPVLQFRPGTVRAVRALYGLDGPRRMAEAVDQLQDWVKKQPHFKKKEFNRLFLENTILSSKGSMERARLRLEKYCTMRTTMPKFFEKYDVRNEMTEVLSAFYLAVMPRMTADFCRILFFKMHKSLKASTLSELYQYYVSQVEYLKVNDYFNGVIAVVDQRGMNILDIVVKLNPFELSQCFKLFMNGYGLRIRGIHLLTESRLIGVLVTVMKKLVSAKVGSRIQVHKNLDSLYEAVPREYLPDELGGMEKSYVKLHEEWVEMLSRPEHVKHMRIMKKVGVDDSKRTDKQTSEHAVTQHIDHLSID